MLPCPDPGTPHQFPRNRPRFCYVMTDFTQRTVDFWLRHPPLLPLLEAGVMDVAVYDADPPGAGPNPGPVELKLQYSGTTLSASNPGTLLNPGGGLNPVVVVANYVFDTLRQDAFQVRSDGRLYQGLSTLRSDRPEFVPGHGGHKGNARGTPEPDGNGRQSPSQQLERACDLIAASGEDETRAASAAGAAAAPADGAKTPPKQKAANSDGKKAPVHRVPSKPDTDAIKRVACTWSYRPVQRPLKTYVRQTSPQDTATVSVRSGLHC